MIPIIYVDCFAMAASRIPALLEMPHQSDESIQATILSLEVINNRCQGRAQELSLLPMDHPKQFFLFFMHAFSQTGSLCNPLLYLWLVWVRISHGHIGRLGDEWFRNLLYSSLCCLELQSLSPKRYSMSYFMSPGSYKLPSREVRHKDLHAVIKWTTNYWKIYEENSWGGAKKVQDV